MSTAFRRKKAKRNQKIINDRQRLLSLPGAMATAVDEQLSKKYGISRTTIWKIVKHNLPATQPCNPS